MSDALAISGVTAVLQYFLNIIYNDPDSPLGGVTVTAIAPDIVQNNIGAGNTRLQVNIFMHQVTPNAAWRNVDLPSLAPDGRTRLKNPPLALNLHYLLTAYASEDTQAEALLGYALLMMHENPVFVRNQVSIALNNLPSSNPLRTALSTSGLENQIEMLKLTPGTLGREELAWLWTALKADFRPTYAFDVSVVLMENPLRSSFAFPVLSRNINIRPGAPPVLTEIQPPGNQTASAPGDTVTAIGQFLSGASLVSLSNRRLGIRYPPFAPTSVSGSSVVFAVPEDATKLPAGLYDISVLFTNPAGQILATTNVLQMAIAPKIRTAPAPTAVTNASGTVVTLSADPEARPNQRVALALGEMVAPAQAFTASTALLHFQFPVLTPGPYLARLRVDGIDSPINVDFTVKPPVFLGPFITVV
jgi:hypothetical protein